MPNPSKHPAPAKVRGKVGAKKKRSALLDVGQKYISGQVQGDPGNKLAPQAGEVAQTRTSLVALLGTKSDLKAKLTKNAGDIVLADTAYTAALVYTILFLSLGFLVKLAGQVSLAHFGFAAIGAASCARR